MSEVIVTVDGVRAVNYRQLVALTGYSLDTLRTYKMLGRLPEPVTAIGNQPWWSIDDIKKWAKVAGIELGEC